MDSARPGDTRTALRGGVLDGESVADFQITLATGPESGKAWVVAGGDSQRMYVGSSEACELQIADEHVSRRHLAVSATPLGLKVEDLDSKNGTWVDTTRVGSAFLVGGEVITIGTTRLVVAAVREPTPSRAPAIVRFGRVIGASLPMRKRYPVYQRIAESDVAVLIEGETGSGKEVLAESIHEASPRAGGAFVIFDCTTVAAHLVEATLFGHEKGAGVFELAEGGTLFIDEIGDLDVMLQGKLLRAIQSQQVQRLGGTQWVQTNVRIISATRRDLEKEIQAGRFRDDLFFRLVVARIELPPLRDRRDDIPLLARTFWSKLGGKDEDFPADLLANVEDYAWPGNVRELHNRVAHRLALGDLASASPQQRPSAIPPSAAVAPPTRRQGDIVDRVISEKQPFARARERVVFEFERRYTDWALAEHGGNVTKAAEACGIGRRYFYVIRSRSSGGS